MKLNRKMLIIAKGVSVWWGIYLILGCCAGFAVRMMQTLFMPAKPLEIIVYAPYMCVCALILAVLTYFIGETAKKAPRRKLRRQLFAIMAEEGFSSNYTSKLFENARDDMKNVLYIEAACVYCMRGEYEAAEKTLEVVDMVSVTDIAQSTGDFRIVAYYYCVKMALRIIQKDADGAARAYDDGIYYLDAYEGNDIVMAVLSLYQTEAGLYNSAIDTVEKIKWKSLPRKLRKRYGKAFSNYVKACNLLNMGKYDDAVIYARMSLEAPCTEYIASEAEEIIKRAKSAKHSAVQNT
ncbi:MAG: hypothetical protein IJZ61_08225 [Oscillospiraceae bacterium]|nr:hypothetical protein [Oscillospiraceae bacterium]